MARLRMRIVLDEPDRTYRPTETVSGRIEVEVDEDAACDSLGCFVRWKATGDANGAEGASDAVRLAHGEWKGGDRLSYPFALPVPDGPPTYAGKRFSVQWAVVAEASLNWALDPEAEATFTVAAAPAGEGSLQEKREAGGFEIGCAVVCLVAFLLSAAVLVLARGFPGAGWVVAAILGGLGALVMVPQAVARRRLGHVLLECGPSPVPRGGEFAYRIVVHPAKRLVPVGVKAVLLGVEQSVKGSGKSRKTRIEEIAKHTAALEGPAAVEGGTDGVWAGVLRVPEDASPSFEAGPHKVEWKVKFSIDQDWLPEVSREIEVRVA